MTSTKRALDKSQFSKLLDKTRLQPQRSNLGSAIQLSKKQLCLYRSNKVFERAAYRSHLCDPIYESSTCHTQFHLHLCKAGVWMMPLRWEENNMLYLWIDFILELPKEKLISNIIQHSWSFANRIVNNILF
ncbi:hypothetical protein NC652_020637 [Populus alba x Populus x berolinensis]|nr:hypothetical protein NC652_020637 [Populus alba x Populus x berolinensis]